MGHQEQEQAVIPVEAVEAAKFAYFNAPSPGMRAALEAAAPHMMAQVWDEGRKHGATYPYGERGLATDDNPYRSHQP